MQSILGALLTAGYAAAITASIAAAPSSEQSKITDSVAEPADEVVRRRGGHRRAVSPVREPDHRGGEDLLPDGDDYAYTAGIVAILLGATLVFFLFPKKEEEERLLRQYHAEDTGEPVEEPGAPGAGLPRPATG